MFMQQLPKPGPGVCVAVEECERTITSAPLKTPAEYMTVFAAGDASSSAGVPYTVTVPGILAREPRDELGQGERPLQVVDAASHVGGGGALGGRLLRGGGDRAGEGAHDEGGERHCGAHDEPRGCQGSTLTRLSRLPSVNTASLGCHTTFSLPSGVLRRRWCPGRNGSYRMIRPGSRRVFPGAMGPSTLSCARS